MSVIPLRDIGRRLPQVGRLRLGRPGNKGPIALSKFRFTSPSRELIVKVAELYGGEPKAWDTHKSDDRYEVFSEANEIKVVLAPDAYDAHYERWRGSINDRRCDGIDCVTTIPGADGPEKIERPCLCHERGVLECELTQRLNVILPNVRGLGVWRLDTKSEYAARELPGMVEAIQALDGGRGMMRAVLRAEQRHATRLDRKGKPYRRNYVVPVLDFDASLDEIVEGAARVSIGTGHGPGPEPSTGVGPSAQLPALSPGGPDLSGDGYFDPQGAVNPDDVVIDAEVVDDATKLDAVEEWAAGLDPRDRARVLRDARAVAAELGEPVPAAWNAITGKTLEAIYRTLNEE